MQENNSISIGEINNEKSLKKRGKKSKVPDGDEERSVEKEKAVKNEMRKRVKNWY